MIEISSKRLFMSKSSEGGTKLRLLEAAEVLFAEQGFEAVSVRDITKVSEANVAAVNYHFGSREGLVEAVAARWVNPVNEERLVRLDQLEAKWGGKAVPLEELLDAFVRPFLTQIRKSELSEKIFSKLLGRAFAESRACLAPGVEPLLRRAIDRFKKAFHKSLPTVDEEELWWRFHFMAGVMLHTLAHQELLQHLSNGEAGDPSLETTLVRCIRFAAAGMREGVDLSLVPRGPQSEFTF